jgi:hypothetical protein
MVPAEFDMRATLPIQQQDAAFTFMLLAGGPRIERAATHRR